MATNKALDKILKKESKKFVKSVMKDVRKIIAEVNDEMNLEVRKMYESYIDAFYSYPTTSYVRHGMSKPGAGGLNLYRAFDSKAVNTRGGSTLYVSYSSADMEGDRYAVDSPAEVLEYVFSGVRFPYWDYMTWSYNYSSRDFSCNGTLQEAIEKFDREFYDIAYKKFDRKWHKLSWI